MTQADIAGLTSSEPNKMFEEMRVAIRDSLSDVSTSDDGEDWEDEDDKETGHGKLSDDDEPCWVMGTITTTVQQHMEAFQQKQMTLDELTQPGWEDSADYFRERDEKCGTSKLRVLTVVQQQTYDDAPAPPPTTFGGLMESVDIVPRIWQSDQGTPLPGSSHVRPRSVKP